MMGWTTWTSSGLLGESVSTPHYNHGWGKSPLMQNIKDYERDNGDKKPFIYTAYRLKVQDH